MCHRRDEPIAVALTGYFNGVVEGLWAGGGLLARKLDANYVLYWEMIRDACLRGCRSFHLGRSTRRFRRRRIQAQMECRSAAAVLVFPSPDGGAEMPALNVDNPKYRLAISAWRQLPLSVDARSSARRSRGSSPDCAAQCASSRPPELRLRLDRHRPPVSARGCSRQRARDHLRGIC